MRIFHLIDHWGLGGAQRVVATLTRLEPHHEHHIVAIFQHDQHPWHTPVQPEFLSASYRGLPLAVRRLRKLLVREKPDIVHVHLHGARFVTHCALIGMRTKPRIIWHEHSEGEIFERFHPWISQTLIYWQRRQVRKGIVFASPTRSGLDFIRETFAPKDPLLFHLPNPVDAQSIREAANQNTPPERPHDAPVVAFIGRLAPQKGAESVVPLFNRFLDMAPGAKLWIVGDGILRDKMEHQAHSLKLLPHINFLGARSDVEAIVNSVDLVMMPSAYEPFGMVAAEAFCLNKPVVGHNVDGLGELLTQHPLGYPVNLFDRDGFIEAMVTAIHRAPATQPNPTPYWEASVAVPKWSEVYDALT
jgi:glycosyltransferase involved in cell wall biosynthesis